MQRAIVGVALEVQRWEGVWKVSQNRTDEDRAGVVQGLRAEGTPPPKTWRPGAGAVDGLRCVVKLLLNQ